MALLKDTKKGLEYKDFYEIDYTMIFKQPIRHKLLRIFLAITAMLGMIFV